MRSPSSKLPPRSPAPPSPAGATPGRKKHAAAPPPAREWLVIAVDGRSYTEEIGKQSIMRRAGLPARDLRVLDPLLSYPSSILGRDMAIVVNLEHIRAIVTASEVLIPNSKDPLVVPLVSELSSRLSVFQSPQQPQSQEEEVTPLHKLLSLEASEFGHTKVLPFEFRALEVCLEYACNGLESETSKLEKEAYPALDELTSKVSTLNLERIRQMKSRFVALAGRVQKVRDELERLLEDDADMATMHLSEKLIYKAAGGVSSRFNLDKDPAELDDQRDDKNMDDGSESSDQCIGGFRPNISELEILLEAYFVQIDGTLNKLSILREYIHDTEDYINIMLDDKQNQLLQMGVMLTTTTMIATCTVIITGFISINVHISFYDSPGVNFWDIIWALVAGSIGLLFIVYAGYKKSGLLQ